MTSISGTLYYGTASVEVDDERTEELVATLEALQEKNGWFEELEFGWVGSLYGGYTEMYLLVKDSEVQAEWGTKEIPDGIWDKPEGYNWFGLVAGAVEELGFEVPGNIAWHVAALEG